MQDLREASRSWEKQRDGFFLRGMKSYPHFYFGPARTMLNFLLKCWKINVWVLKKYFIYLSKREKEHTRGAKEVEGEADHHLPC